MEEYLPPLPVSITSILHSTKLCYLATSEDHVPHLSLMNFSYVHDEEYGKWKRNKNEIPIELIVLFEGEVLVMSTRTNTKKYEALLKNPKVAILIHDFDCKRSPTSAATLSTEPSSAFPGTFSVTIYGEVTIACGDRAELLRSKHLEINPDYEQFICGEGRAVLIIRPSFARLCNIHDTVHHWSCNNKI